MLTLLFDRTETETELIRFSSPLLVVLSCRGNEAVVVESWIGDEVESWIWEGSMGEGLGVGEAEGRFSIMGTPLMSTTTEFVASVGGEGTGVVLVIWPSLLLPIHSTFSSEEESFE